MVNGEKYATEMPAMNYLTDEQIADVLNYVRNSFENKITGSINAGMVKPYRKKIIKTTTLVQVALLVPNFLSPQRPLKRTLRHRSIISHPHQSQPFSNTIPRVALKYFLFKFWCLARLP